MDERSVIVVKGGHPRYPAAAPFHPELEYPEYPFGGAIGAEPNSAYASVRRSLELAGLDPIGRGTPAWNPLGEFIRPGQFVLLKPNLVRQDHARDPDGWPAVLTHGSVVRAVADYVWKALEGRGRVVVADGPQTDASFEAILRRTGLDAVRDFYRSRGLDLELVDLRREEFRCVEEVVVDRRPLPGDALGNIHFDLGDASAFAEHGGAGRYYGADYDSDEVNYHHSGGRHEYLIAGSAIHCDVFINLPKLKTHKKAGVSINLKNLVGVNGDKNWLPHHTSGSPRDGGDQFPDASAWNAAESGSARALRQLALASPRVGTWLLRKARRAGKVVFGGNDRVIRSGNWHGNDTVWRMCLDLNAIVLYGGPDGSICPPGPSSRKAYLSFVDGIVAGEGDGPMAPDPVDAGLLLFGANPAHVDAAAAVLMGFDPDKIPLIRGAFAPSRYPISAGGMWETACVSDDPALNGPLDRLADSDAGLRFRPHFGWRGRIELEGRPAIAAGTAGERGDR